MAKEKHYIIENSTLMTEWNWEKNADLDPLLIGSSSHKKVWWKCKNGHEWEAVIASRNSGCGCPYCAGQKTVKGYNDLQTVDPILANEWNNERNNGLLASDVLPNSGKKAWWKCKNGHEWEAVIASRSRGNGCPYCAGKKTIKGSNDLQTINPILAEEWNYEKNGELTPSDVTSNSEKKVWWKCKNGHEWAARIADRSKGHECVYCSGRKVLKGYNDLQTVNPGLAKEWNFEQNGTLTPENFTANSGEKVWWRCGKGHEWQATIANRNHGNGCPYCAGQRLIRGQNDLQTVDPILSSEWNQERNHGLTPADVFSNSNQKAWWKCSKGHEWEAIIANRAKGNGCPICNSEQRTSFPEYALAFYFKKHGLEVIHSYKELGYELDVYIPSKKIAIEYDGYYWHKDKTVKDLEKNKKCKDNGITLYRIREGVPSLNDSSIDILAQKGQKDLSEVLTKILSEIIGIGIIDIDVDLERDSIAIENLREYAEKMHSFLASNPEMAKEWNYEKNGILKPEHCTLSSGKKVWWKCNKGHEWKAVIAERHIGSGCPYCAGQKVLKGYNDLQTTNPSLAKEWNYERNGELTPADVLPHSNKKAWWKCKNGHEWEAVIASRNSGCGCPYCSGRLAIKGSNDLLTLNPNLANEWNYEKNKGLTPMDVMPNSGIKVWWKCSKGHEWNATINHRNQGHGCPYCAGQKVLKGYNDLQTANPDLAKEWNYEKNGNLTPEIFTANSGIKVWWRCAKNHEWQAIIANRNRGRGCPYCSGRKK